MFTKTTSSRTGRTAALALLAVALLACLFLSACGASSAPMQTAADSAPAATEVAKDLIPAVPQGGMAPDAEYVEVEGTAAPMAAEETGGAANYTGGGVTQPQDDRKTVLYTTIDMETLAFNETCTKLQQAVSATGGYVAGATINGNETSYSGRTAAFTLKIPRAQFDSFSFGLSSLGTITQRSEAVEDITSQYMDIEARLVALETQEARLLALMEEAGSLEELLQVQQQLTSVQYEIELYRSTQRTYDGLVEYATIDVYVREVKEYTPVEPDSFGSRASAALSDAWDNTVSFLQDLGIFLIRALPVLVFLAIVLAITLLVAKAARKYRAKHPKPRARAPLPASAAAYAAQPPAAAPAQTQATPQTPTAPAATQAAPALRPYESPLPAASPPSRSGGAGKKDRNQKTPLAKTEDRKPNDTPT